jgi:hypothetical protein
MTPSSENGEHREYISGWRDKVTFIGSTFLNGEQEPYLNHCVVLNTCDEVDNATIVSVDTERSCC